MAEISRNHAAGQGWAHLGSNQGYHPNACSSVGRDSAGFAGGSRQANPGNAPHTSARFESSGGHRTDTGASAGVCRLLPSLCTASVGSAVAA